MDPPKLFRMSCGGLVGLAAFQLGLLDEVVVRAGQRVAVIFIERTVVTVRSALGHERPARRKIVLGQRCSSGRDAEFLHRIRRYRQNRLERVTIRIRVYVHAVQSDVALVAACTVHRATARIRSLSMSGRLPVYATPACSESRSGTLRPSIGNCLI